MAALSLCFVDAIRIHRRNRFAVRSQGGGGGSCDAALDLCGKDEDGLMGEVAQGCQRGVCGGLCLDEGAWTCEVEPSGCSGWEGCAKLEQEASDPGVERALCAQLRGFACVETLGCCTEDDKPHMCVAYFIEPTREM